MMNKRWLVAALLMVCTGALNCCQMQAAAGGAPGGAADGAYKGADKILVPAKGWPCGMPAGIPVPEKGKLLFETTMKIDQAYNVGKTQFGQRDVYVVSGGTIASEKLNATVMTLGLDFQLTLPNGAMEIEQILVLRTSDNRYVYLRSAGVGADKSDIRMVPDFEAPNGSTSAWLNTGKFAGRRVVDTTAKTMKISVYDISGETAAADDTNSVKVTKPADAVDQPWDYRKVGPTEKRGEQLIVENVTLGGSQSVGATKKGNRNIIPITGGTITGKITGKVLPGGADYQNLSNPATIDARYLWQTADGDVIIVRNAGPMAQLIPIFEVKQDSKYFYLTKGLYMSSSPGMGSGGVSLTFFESQK